MKFIALFLSSVLISLAGAKMDAPQVKQPDRLLGTVFVATGNPLDLAIDGDGYFQIRRSDGSIVYTRNGRFMLNSDNQISTPRGYVLEPQISVPEEAIATSIENGYLSALLKGQDKPVVIGQLLLAHFHNRAALKEIEKGIYLPTPKSGEPTVRAADSKLDRVVSRFLAAYRLADLKVLEIAFGTPAKRGNK